MSQESNVILKTFEAEADLSLGRYHFVELGAGTNQVDLVDNVNDIPVGVLYDWYRATAGNPVSVAIAGSVKVVASAAIAKGAWVGSTNAGAAVTKAGAGAMVRGIALETALNAGEIIEILLVGPFLLHA